MRRARTPQELWAIRTALLGAEELPLGDFRKAYRAANSDKARLSVVRTFLEIAPHHPGLRRRLFALLEATGEKESLLDEVRKARQDPLADATVLADGAAALRRAGLEAEARRAYGELVERAPNDPSVRAFLGDRLRAEGWPHDAHAAYAALEELATDEPATLLRLALAHQRGRPREGPWLQGAARFGWPPRAHRGLPTGGLPSARRWRPIAEEFSRRCRNDRPVA